MRWLLREYGRRLAKVASRLELPMESMAWSHGRESINGVQG